MIDDRYFTAQEAAGELGISVATLYSYVSRGLIQSEVADEGKRTRRYRREDVTKLKERKEHRHNPAKVAESALHWGAPVMESAITNIVDNHLYYRGQDVLQLVAGYTVEQVAALIWLGSFSLEVRLFGADYLESYSSRLHQLRQHIRDLAPVEKFQMLLPLAAGEDLAGYDLRPSAVAETGARILQLLTTIAVDNQTSDQRIAHRLQQGWISSDTQAANLINAALILCADHELNVSSFTARCVASAGATPYEVVLAGLAALQGVKHGRNTERVEALFREVKASVEMPASAVQASDVRTTIAGRLRRGDPIPGFGHPLYPDGDPRGRILLDLTADAYPTSPMVTLARVIARETDELIGQQPNIDFALVVLAWAANLPPGSPIALFALGRTMGWIGHAIEQYQVGRIIRPRARYTGVPPVTISRRAK